MIVSVDGKTVDRRRVAARRRRPPTSRATRCTVVVDRDGKQVTHVGDHGRPPTTAARSSASSTRDEADYPFSVEISLKDVGGPSAGLMFALGIVDKLTPGSLTGGKFIAGTGTIDDAGQSAPSAASRRR